MEKNIEINIFGSSIEYATFFTYIKDKYKVPKIVRDCIQFLEESGLENIGLYRISGSTIKVRNIKQKYNSYSFKKINLKLENLDVNDVSALLKSYFRSLSDGFIPREILSYLEQAINICSDSNKNMIKLVRYYLFFLPESTFCTLGWLLKHLRKIAIKSMDNKMSYENIITIFSPCLNIPPNILMKLVRFSEEIFPENEIQR
ncbi:hypothetical protein HZS_88 [Henneguya salminicola]|uniref:Active breakpoint cluster region-related protein (Trinotate prediction) n=1 Tax=Henneguya salminicola TaxID=69463 RepID=A0A6G3MFT4_HENSL|nr:hypothetical protein HZS_88 [Henneguya salminicola]